ncbi:MAG: helix-turn-helix transcriptional regulator [Opitutaceae bacterium]|nr:helix-turn-helix transcriptional regulator [Opitutaceae bacterium]
MPSLLTKSERRQSLGLLQVDLAERSRVAVATIRHFENSEQVSLGGLVCALSHVSLGTLLHRAA